LRQLAYNSRHHFTTPAAQQPGFIFSWLYQLTGILVVYNPGMKGNPQKAIVLLAVVILFALPGRGQFSDSVHHYLGYGATGIFNQTSTSNSFVLSNAIKFNINQKKKFFNSGAAWVYGRQNGNLTNNDFTSFVNFDRYGLWPHFYYWGLVTYDKVYSLKVNDRFQGGPGLGYNALDRKNATVVVSDGVLFEYSNINDAAGLRQEYSTLRNSLRVKYHFVLKQLLVLDGVHYWQQSFSKGDDYILKSSSSLSVKLKKWLSITSALNYNKVTRTNSKKLLFTFGLAADYYF
jgi:hypothetical protein